MREINAEVITLEDCVTLFEAKGLCPVVNDGQIKGFEDYE